MSKLQEWENQIICGSNPEALKPIPDETISCVMCSPPYWSQRDYKVKGQIGLEETFQEWLEKMWLIMDEIWRVLRKDGTCWINLGDKYGTHTSKRSGQFGKEIKDGFDDVYMRNIKVSGSEKSLLFLPERFAIGCLERGWTIPNKNIWHKPNPMPSSGKGRFTNTWEYLYFMVKNTKPIMWIHRYTAEMVGKKPKDRTKIVCPECGGTGKQNVMLYEDSFFPQPVEIECSECSVKGKGTGEVSIWRSEDYFFDLDAVRRPHKENTIERCRYPTNDFGGQPDSPHSLLGKGKQGGSAMTMVNLHPAGKNPGDVIIEDKTCGGGQDRNSKSKILLEFTKNTPPLQTDPGDFWSIPTQPSKLKHYASYPEKLCLTPLKAGCPRWICKECGMARVRISKVNAIPTRPGRITGTGKSGQGDDPNRNLHTRDPQRHIVTDVQTLPWSFCSCLCPVCGEANCKCGEKWRPGIVLDPFVGIGTTCIVAKKLGLSYLGIDLKKEYCDMAEKRLKDVRYQEEMSL